MSDIKAIAGADIFDGEKTHVGHALLYSGDQIVSISAQEQVPANAHITEVDGGLLVPGFVDLQVNGGGGVLLNDNPSVEAIKTICDAHAKFGTTSLLPTLITDTPELTRQAIMAGIEAYKQNVDGFLGLHLEGPHLATARKGAHDANLIREMGADDLELLLYARAELPNLMVTVAVESVTLEQIETLSSAGIIVSLGHTNSSYEDAIAAAKSGATCVTHLYNAMSPLTHRAPGLVGAALNDGAFYSGLIADGHHVKNAAMSIAINAKSSPGKIFLVTDAMSTIGTDLKSFVLNDRVIYRDQGILALEDGTLAGADLDMMTAVKNVSELELISFEEAVRMASVYPAECMRIVGQKGMIKSGLSADFIHLNEDRKIKSVWRAGKEIGQN